LFYPQKIQNNVRIRDKSKFIILLCLKKKFLLF